MSERIVTSVRGRGGLTLLELLLVTVILGLVINLLTPFFNRARERQWSESLARDVAGAVEAWERYYADEGVYPASPEALAAAGWAPTPPNRVCTFRGMPATRFRGDYFVIVLARPEGSSVAWTAYPTFGGRVQTYTRPGRTGCQGF